MLLKVVTRMPMGEMNDSAGPLPGSPTKQPILWLEDLPPRPLCDVPWMGNTVVRADGQVSLCCFSSAKVGNVNDTPLREIWNNDQMRRIRRSLRDQTLPPECRSPSCPIYRGDQNHFILTRMDGWYREQATGTADPLMAIRQGFVGSGMQTLPGGQSAASPGIEFVLRYAGTSVCVDVYLAIRGTDRLVRFLPRLESVPLPYRVGLHLSEDESFAVPWHPQGGPAMPPGIYEVCIAVFGSGSHPTIPSNCYWNATVTCELTETPA